MKDEPKDVEQILKQYAHVDDEELGEDKFVGHYDAKKTAHQLDAHYRQLYISKFLELVGADETPYDFASAAAKVKYEARNQLRHELREALKRFKEGSDD